MSAKTARYSQQKNNHRKGSKTFEPLQPKTMPLLVVIPLVAFLAIYLLLNFKTTTETVAQLLPSESHISPIFTEQVRYWEPQILRWSSDHQLDPNLVATIMQIESCGNPNARSGAGATGLFQVMPFHFTDTDNMFDPETNALRGLDYLARSWEYSNGNAYFALAGYNGGISLIDAPQYDWPTETDRYVYWGTGIYNDATNGLSESARLQEWLEGGGSSLCTSAADQLASE